MTEFKKKWKTICKYMDLYLYCKNYCIFMECKDDNESVYIANTLAIKIDADVTHLEIIESNNRNLLDNINVETIKDFIYSSISEYGLTINRDEFEKNFLFVYRNQNNSDDILERCYKGMYILSIQK